MRTGSYFLKFPAADGVSESTAANTLDGYSVAATFNSAPFYVGRSLGYCVVVSCPATGSPAATVKLQGCVDRARINDEHPDTALTNFFDLGFVNPTTGAIVTSQTISNASALVFEESACFYGWVRLVFTYGSGTCALTAKVQTKGNA